MNSAFDHIIQQKMQKFSPENTSDILKEQKPNIGSGSEGLDSDAMNLGDQAETHPGMNFDLFESKLKTVSAEQLFDTSVSASLTSFQGGQVGMNFDSFADAIAKIRNQELFDQTVVEKLKGFDVVSGQNFDSLSEKLNHAHFDQSCRQRLNFYHPKPLVGLNNERLEEYLEHPQESLFDLNIKQRSNEYHSEHEPNFEAFEIKLNDKLELKQQSFDYLIDQKVGNYIPKESGKDFDAFYAQLNDKLSTAAKQFDDIVNKTMSNSKSSTGQSWEILEKTIQAELTNRRRILMVKLVEAAIFVLAIFTYLNYQPVLEKWQNKNAIVQDSNDKTIASKSKVFESKKQEKLANSGNGEFSNDQKEVNSNTEPMANSIVSNNSGNNLDITPKPEQPSVTAELAAASSNQVKTSATRQPAVNVELNSIQKTESETNKSEITRGIEKSIPSSAPLSESISATTKKPSRTPVNNEVESISTLQNSTNNENKGVFEKDNTINIASNSPKKIQNENNPSSNKIETAGLTNAKDAEKIISISEKSGSTSLRNTSILTILDKKTLSELLAQNTSGSLLAKLKLPSDKKMQKTLGGDNRIKLNPKGDIVYYAETYGGSNSLLIPAPSRSSNDANLIKSRYGAQFGVKIGAQRNKYNLESGLQYNIHKLAEKRINLTFESLTIPVSIGYTVSINDKLQANINGGIGLNIITWSQFDRELSMDSIVAVFSNGNSSFEQQLKQHSVIYRDRYSSGVMAIDNFGESAYLTLHAGLNLQYLLPDRRTILVLSGRYAVASKKYSEILPKFNPIDINIGLRRNF